MPTLELPTPLAARVLPPDQARVFLTGPFLMTLDPSSHASVPLQKQGTRRHLLACLFHLPSSAEILPWDS